MDKNIKINGKNTYKPERMVNKNKLVDFQAPENSLVLSPLLKREDALKMFNEWLINTYSKDVSWKEEIVNTEYGDFLNKVGKIEIIELKK